MDRPPKISQRLTGRLTANRPAVNRAVLFCASGRQIVERFQFPRCFVDAPLQVTSSAWLGINRGMPSARIGVNGDTQIRLVESTADHVRKLNGTFLFVGHLRSLLVALKHQLQPRPPQSTLRAHELLRSVRVAIFAGQAESAIGSLGRCRQAAHRHGPLDPGGREFAECRRVIVDARPPLQMVEQLLPPLHPRISRISPHAHVRKCRPSRRVRQAARCCGLAAAALSIGSIPFVGYLCVERPQVCQIAFGSLSLAVLPE